MNIYGVSTAPCCVLCARYMCGIWGVMPVSQGKSLLQISPRKDKVGRIWMRSFWLSTEHQLANVSLLGCLLLLLAGQIIVCTGAELAREGGGIMAACINGNGVMTGQTDPGPKIAGVGFNWGILLWAREPEVGQRGPAHKIIDYGARVNSSKGKVDNE